jgi:hypothetical protein
LRRLDSSRLSASSTKRGVWSASIN